MNNWELDYINLVSDVIKYGVPHETRVGMAHAALGTGLSIKVADGEFPLLTTRKLFYKPVFGELTGFLMGSAHNFDFTSNGCNYWTPNARAWAEKVYGERAKDIADEDLPVGHIYGYQWRRWAVKPGLGFDQLAEAQRLIKKEPNSRRIMVTAWEPADLHNMCLPPCHTHFQYHVLGDKLHCSVYMRSVDLCLGLPADITLYYALLILMAKDCDILPGTLHFHFGNAHVYADHIVPFLEQQPRVIKAPPVYWLQAIEHGERYIDDFKPDLLKITEYEPADAIKYELLV
jgi:thymidylate synthase